MIHWIVLWSHPLPLLFSRILLPVKLLHLSNRPSTVMFFCVCAPLHLISVAFMNVNERLQGQFTRLYSCTAPQSGVELYEPILVHGWMLMDPALCSFCADNHYCYMFAFIISRSYLEHSVLLYCFPPSDSYSLLSPFISCSAVTCHFQQLLVLTILSRYEFLHCCLLQTELSLKCAKAVLIYISILKCLE